MLAEALFVGRLNAGIQGTDILVITRSLIVAGLAETFVTFRVAAKSCGPVTSIARAQVAIPTLKVLGHAETFEGALVDGSRVTVIAFIKVDAGDVTVYLRSLNTGTDGL